MRLRDLERFEIIARNASRFTEARDEHAEQAHPFDERDIHELVQDVALELFDNGHYSQATFEAFKLVDKVVQSIAKSTESGVKLMMSALGGASPKVRIGANSTQSEKDEQEGYKFLFAGSMLAIRNPRGHEFGLMDDVNECLDHLSLASLLLRRLEAAGHTLTPRK